jgi:hypothetical protein
MKKSYQHIIKKSYTTPKIEEVEIDREMSLVMESLPVNPEDPTDPTDLDGVGSYDQKELPSYRSATYPEASTPFGGSMPEY